LLLFALSASVFDVTSLIAAFLSGTALFLATLGFPLLVGGPAIHFGLPGFLTGVLVRIPCHTALPLFLSQRA
jgi:hypothetical protein